jgi:hypothetical protein
MDMKSAKVFYKNVQLMVFSHLPSHYTFINQSLNKGFWRSLIGDGHLISGLKNEESVRLQWLVDTR